MHDDVLPYFEPLPLLLRPTESALAQPLSLFSWWGVLCRFRFDAVASVRGGAHPFIMGAPAEMPEAGIHVSGTSIGQCGSWRVVVERIFLSTFPYASGTICIR